MEVLLFIHCRSRVLSILVKQQTNINRLHQTVLRYTSSYNPAGSTKQQIHQQHEHEEDAISNQLNRPVKPDLNYLDITSKATTSVQQPVVLNAEDEDVINIASVKDEWKEQRVQINRLPYIYLKLSKYRLTTLVVLTTLTGYTMAPGPLSTTLLYSCLGTALCSASANTFNQWLEVPFDSQMARTRNRVLVRGLIIPLHAFLFGTVTGLTGSAILMLGVNSLTALLGVFNILLYSAVYTPMKRLSIANTWVGSVVGAIPPLMGWTACTGSLSSAGLVMAAILFAWQFPHFNSLSWSYRADYSRGGYRMMSVTDPALCRRVALRYCIALVPICTLGPITGLTNWWFAVDSLPLNVWFSYLAWKFYHDADFKSARKLFHFSLFHLPLIMGLIILNKSDWNNKKSKELSINTAIS